MVKIKNLVRVQVLVSHSPPLVDSQESHQEKSYKDVFMDGDWSSAFSPSSSKLSITSHYLQYVQIKIIKKIPCNFNKLEVFAKIRTNYLIYRYR
ncbi:hypothetical protein E2C01_068714 [Portunus trituberculatus]|uniref:Uncharacterized protein n=1 Tax=Portunus trituberculatus TaxID=210409 RepID=A0A5B7HWX1_PORTR|nr:hypothetical protein [Portunus trituberculatus]